MQADDPPGTRALRAGGPDVVLGELLEDEGPHEARVERGEADRECEPRQDQVVRPLERVAEWADVPLDRQPVHAAAQRDPEQLALRRLIGEQERQHRRHPEDRRGDRRLDADREDPVDQAPRPQRAHEPDAERDREPQHRRPRDERGGDAGGREDDVGHVLAALERVAEVPVGQPPDELRVLEIPRPVGTHDVRDLAHARRRRPFAGDALRRVRARQVGDQEEEHERDEGDDQQLHERGDEPVGGVADHVALLVAKASRSPSPSSWNESITAASVSPGISASQGCTR